MASITTRPALVQIVLLAALVLPVTGCGLPPDSLPPIPEAETSRYHLGAGDTVRVITVGEDAVTGQFRVASDGAVDMPLIGPVQAAGLTPGALSRNIADALHVKRHYRDPSVSVEVAAYRTLAVIGEVNRPGQYPYQPDMTVVLAIASAGGFTYRAADDRFAIRRTVDGHALEGRANLQTRLLPGDVITVYDRQF